MKKVELLAPCGTYDSFIAAMKAGADAVYLGLEKFGARANAGNFTYEELEKALFEAHIWGKKVYLTVNTLFKDKEMEELYSFLKDPYEWGLDGVIVQDIGVMNYISRNFPEMEIHASTQAAITSKEGYELLKEYNVTRIVPARELSLDEIRDLFRRTGAEIECFIHGALCYSYSGKCLFSSFLGGRSGNRGRCAQPCRLCYNDKYILSMKDLCTIDIVPELIEAGIASFKIEGRMKSPEYVYGVTSLYRKYIDLYYSGSKYQVSPQDKELLLSLYTRSGNCEGYYHYHNSRNMITIDSPSYDSKANRNDYNITDISAPQRPVKADIIIKEGRNVSIKVYDHEFSAETITDVCPQKAQKLCATVDTVAKQLNKTGNSHIFFEKLNIDLEDGLFIPNGLLNSVRRAGVENFENQIKLKNARVLPERMSLLDASEEIDTAKDKIPSVNVSVLKSDHIKWALKYAGINGIIIPSFLILQLKDSDFCKLTQMLKNSKKDIFIQLPFVFRNDAKCDTSRQILDAVKRMRDQEIKIKGVYCSNFEEISFVKENLDTDIVGDFFAYAYNNEAVKAYKDMGVSKLTVPVELSAKEILNGKIPGAELIIYGKMPMMTTAGCVYNTLNGCNFSKEGHSLYIKDRKGSLLPVFCNCIECNGVIYNSIPTYLGDKDDFMELISPSSVRIMFCDEDEQRFDEVMNLIMGDSKDKGLKYGKAEFNHTRGHFNRGID